MTLPSWTLLAQSILSGLFAGALYGLLGLGLSLSWGMLRQINLAHFALAFLGAYLTYQLSTTYSADPLLTLLLIVPLFFAIGATVHLLLSRFRVSSFNSMLVTFGMTVMVEALLQWVWSADYRRLESHYSEYKLRLGQVYLPAPEMMTLGASVAIALGTWFVLQRTDIGKALRASAEDASIAAAFGVNQQAMALLLSGFNAALAGIAGVCIALGYTLAPSQIYTWIGVIFACVMLGGLGRPLGPLLAGVLIGVTEALTMAVASPSWAPLVSFALLMAVLLVRPGRI
ncbi:branched-chain amino acid ABC transporter permease [Variovorax dokdonensis]|uniref:Branched-chain amino acid ABC transporter permease n=1 Tax=Variovorax dokdonensis TaxID=344883 RepID=A0ABT7N925_9BURK|nr:branched-chain amino acid ABC transporter permease [Variovorax dokdonensis]MDM0044424.1 branched-chain amino acid ABC transporter permease [Variovorax dokdonensis]